MRKQAFSDYVKRLALLTEPQRVLLAQALAASSGGAMAGPLGGLPDDRQPARIARPAPRACTPGGAVMAWRATVVTPAAEPATR